jgi:hypothetical protein
MTIEELFEASSEIDCRDSCVYLGINNLKDRDRPIERVRLVGVISTQNPEELGAEKDTDNIHHFVVETETEGETAKVVVQVKHEVDETAETMKMKQSVIPGQRVHIFGKTFICPLGPDRVIVMLADAVRTLS